MQTLSTGREAKEYLVALILAQSLRDGIALSEIERKMLYFSETHWTLPDIAEVNEEFESAYDQFDYERKIVILIRSTYKSLDRDQQHQWFQALDLLKREDHYLFVLLEAASIRRPATSSSPVALSPRSFGLAPGLPVR